MTKLLIIPITILVLALSFLIVFIIGIETSDCVWIGNGLVSKIEIIKGEQYTQVTTYSRRRTFTENIVIPDEKIVTIDLPNYLVTTNDTNDEYRLGDKVKVCKKTFMSFSQIFIIK